MKKLLFTSLIMVLFISSIVFAANGIVRGSNDAIDISIELKKGWNLVSGGVFAASPSQNSNIKISDISVVYYFSNLQNKYIMVYPNLDQAALDKETQIEGSFQLESRSAFVYSKKDGKLEFKTDDVLPLNQRKLNKGWNLISMTEEVLHVPLNKLKGSCTFERIHYFSEDEQKWSNNLANDSDFMENEEIDNSMIGNGLAVKVSSECFMNIGPTDNAKVNAPSLPE